jgi:succinylglutamate desuccinylase
MISERIIGSYEGEERGPLLICFGAMHGNEPAGQRALDLMFKMLEVEPITNESFRFKGKIVGMIGNRQAFAQKKRYVDKDLNRQFKEKQIESLLGMKESELQNEDLELVQIIRAVRKEIDDYKPEKLYILDLHTTSSVDGIFCITTLDKESIDIAASLYAPVIKGFLKGIKGTTLHYFKTENTGVPTVAVTFESGQHDEPLSINRAIAAITNFLRIIGSVRDSDVENRHNQLLIEFCKDLPRVAELIERHDIVPEDSFVMRPNFQNFQRQIIADDINGPVAVDKDCLLLMPLYQKQGEEGFFLIKEVKE